MSAQYEVYSQPYTCERYGKSTASVRLWEQEGKMHMWWYTCAEVAGSIRQGQVCVPSNAKIQHMYPTHEYRYTLDSLTQSVGSRFSYIAGRCR